ncbi:hypothetical protein BD410DRAFT_445318 [Rickenella mellea]|uniref:Uncharacterized protein n=1 Tax=Rickenella mellea TaxID=50990 RepID=A0A4Y7PWA6_9AGAM|nr:hypothetical protein BD410DRAFT_445318 [Rickenella mellea]
MLVPTSTVEVSSKELFTRLPWRWPHAITHKSPPTGRHTITTSSCEDAHGHRPVADTIIWLGAVPASGRFDSYHHEPRIPTIFSSSGFSESCQPFTTSSIPDFPQSNHITGLRRCRISNSPMLLVLPVPAITLQVRVNLHLQTNLPVRQSMTRLLGFLHSSHPTACPINVSSSASTSGDRRSSLSMQTEDESENDGYNGGIMIAARRLASLLHPPRESTEFSPPSIPSILGFGAPAKPNVHVTLKMGKRNSANFVGLVGGRMRIRCGCWEGREGEGDGGEEEGD